MTLDARMDTSGTCDAPPTPTRSPDAEALGPQTRSFAQAARNAATGARRLAHRSRPYLRRYVDGLKDAAYRDWTLTGPTVLSWPGPPLRTWAIRLASIAAVVGLWIAAVFDSWLGVHTPPAVALIAAPLMSLPLLALPAGPLIAWRLSSLAGLLWLMWPGDPDSSAWPVAWYLSYLLLCLFTATKVRGAVTAGMASIMGVGITIGAIVATGNETDVSTTSQVAVAMLLMLTVVFLPGFAMHTWSAARAETSASRQVVAKGEERQAVLLERARIARELHDIVTHHMSAIAVQAQAAPLADSQLSEPSREAFAAIEDAARRSLSDLRAAIGVLREDESMLSREPQPTLDALPELVSRARRAGQAIDYSVDLRQDVPASTSVAAYRIVQECLTNALRHAPAERVTIEVNTREAELIVVVVNPLPAGAEIGPDGNGTRGMRERTDALGGTIERATGETYAVEARLPIPQSAAA